MLQESVRSPWVGHSMATMVLHALREKFADAIKISTSSCAGKTSTCAMDGETAAVLCVAFVTNMLVTHQKTLWAYTPLPTRSHTRQSDADGSLKLHFGCLPLFLLFYGLQHRCSAKTGQISDHHIGENQDLVIELQHLVVIGLAGKTDTIFCTGNLL